MTSLGSGPADLRIPALFVGLMLTALILVGGCKVEDGDTIVGPAGPDGPPADPPPMDTVIDLAADLPGLNITITGLTGATGADGTFQAGDTIAVTFTLTKENGAAYPLSELDSARFWMAGPTSNYQRILTGFSTVITDSVHNADGSYTFTFPDPIPETYEEPYNYEGNFPDGVLAGEDLLGGTYTIASRMYKSFTDTTGNSFRDVGNETYDFLFGGATTISSREVVALSSCNDCHSTLQFHGGSYRDVALCITCHTAGSEDRGHHGTIDFKVMIHKIHNGAHLPSVNGITTVESPPGSGLGVRDYTATPAEYLVGSASSPHDYTDLHFPVWPNLGYGMPVDVGYDSLTGDEQDQEDEVLTGVTDCSKCHGGAAQEEFYYTQPSRRACGSCHDDIDWALTYTSNLQQMPSQANDSACADCHTNTANNLDAALAHIHPLEDSDLNPGMHVTISDITPSAGSTLDPGETLSFTFDIKNDDDVDITPSTDLDTLYIVMVGPTDNRNLLLYTTVPTDALIGGPDYTFNVPAPVILEFIGIADGAGAAHMTAQTPIWAEENASTVREVTAVGGAGKGDSTLTADTAIGDDYLTVADTTDFARNDYVVLDFGGAGEEYLRLASVDTANSRLYIEGTSTYTTAPQLVRNVHLAAVMVQEVTWSTRDFTTDYTVTSAPGTITEVAGQFTALNHIVATYTVDWVMPATYMAPFNDSTDLDETWGDWGGKAIEDGTYTLGLWSRQTIQVIPPRALGLSSDDDNTQYRAPSLLATGTDFLVGGATEEEPYSLISVTGTCTDCHNNPQFHGGSRLGVENCLLCHSIAAGEDATQRNYASALPTTGVSITFRDMLHKIHMGANLTNASTYNVLGFNGTAHMYDEVLFPAWPGGTKHCSGCHGSNNDSWMAPSDRSHSTDQTLPVKPWSPVCQSCHDSASIAGHIELNTSLTGYESCDACHGPGSEQNVELKHKTR